VLSAHRFTIKTYSYSNISVDIPVIVFYLYFIDY